MQDLKISKEKRDRARFIMNLMEQSGTVSVRVRKPIFEEVKKICEESGVSINDYISAAVAMRLYWEKNPD